MGYGYRFHPIVQLNPFQFGRVGPTFELSKDLLFHGDRLYYLRFSEVKEVQLDQKNYHLNKNLCYIVLMIYTRTYSKINSMRTKYFIPYIPLGSRTPLIGFVCSICCFRFSLIVCISSRLGSTTWCYFQFDRRKRMIELFI